MSEDQNSADESSVNETAPEETVPESVPDKTEPEPTTPKNPKNKKLILVVLAVLALLLLVAGTVMMMSGNDETEPEDSSQTETTAELKAAVTLIDGTALYSEDGEAWRDLADDATLEQGMYVRTEADSRVILTLDDGSVIRLNNSSEVFLDSLAAEAVLIGNQSGEVYTRVVESDRTFTVNVDEDAYEALGTAYQTTNKPQIKGVKVYQSEVEFKSKSLKVTEGKQYFAKHSDKKLAAKVTTISLVKLRKDDFAKWNLEQDKADAEFKNKLGYLSKIEETKKTNNEQKEDEPSSDGISLSGSSSDKGVALSWSVSGVSGMEGFKAVYSKDSSLPTFGKHSSHYASGADTRSTVVGITDGKTYYFRICAYKNGACSNYSNAVVVKAPFKAKEKVVSGAVSLSTVGTKVKWTFGGTAPYGFKVVYSKTNTAPKYGQDNAAFVGKGTTQYDMSGLSPGTYHVRVCKYTESGCVDYSNKVDVVVS